MQTQAAREIGRLEGRDALGEKKEREKEKSEDKGIHALPINLTEDLKIPKAALILPFSLLFSDPEFSPGLMLESSIFFL